MKSNIELIEAVARKLAGQYMVDDGYSEDTRKSAESGEMWQNFKNAALVAITAVRVFDANP